MVVSNALQSLFLDIQGNNEGGKPGGNPLKRIITLHNRGGQTAHIDLWLEPTDQRSAPLQQWGVFDKSEADLTLQPDQSLDVTLTFEIPLQVEPGFYSYDLRMRSSEYPEEDIRRSQQIQVLPSDQEARLRSEPKLRLTPATDSENPHPLKVGQTLTFTLTVENPSRRTDRFFLTCPDISPDWFTVNYPENTTNLPGLVTYTDGLQLNPRETGEIQLLIHPPKYTPAGHYFPTLRLTSRIREEIVLLKVIYFTLEVDDRMAVAMTPKTLPIPSLNQRFQIALTNEGNIPRHWVYQAWDPDQLLHYVLTPSQLRLAPGEEAIVQLTVHPRRWRHKVWRLKERVIDFDLLVENAPTLTPADSDHPQTNVPAIQSPLPTGTVSLKEQRRWLFQTLVLLFKIAAVSAGIIFLLTLGWFIWEYLFWRPSLRPKIDDFSTTREMYQEGDGDGIRLDWDIVNPDEIGALVLIYEDSQVSQEDRQQPQTYYLNPQPGVVLPPELDNAKCSIEDTAGQNSVVSSLLRLYRRRKTGSPNQQILQCRAIVPTDLISVEGTYAFKLSVFPQAETPLAEEPVDVTLLEDVIVAPPAPPKIQTIGAGGSEYRTVPSQRLTQPLASLTPIGIGGTVMPVANTPSATTGEINAEIQQPSSNLIAEPTIPITLDWAVSNLEDILELRLVSLAPDGSENTLPVTYSFEDGIPPELASFCQGLENRLTCTEVPTNATEVGEYVFYLTVITPNHNPDEPIVKSTPTISIKPPAPEIVDFMVNGESVKTKPRHVFVINPARGSMDVVLSWQVQNAKTVELQPAPGVIEGNIVTYTLSAAAGAETITLRVVNELEEEVTQSVVIEKVEYVPGSQAPLRRASPAPGGTPAQVDSLNHLPILPPPPAPLPVPELAPIRSTPQPQ